MIDVKSNSLMVLKQENLIYGVVKEPSNNYHKQRLKVAKLHLKVSRQRKDKAIKDALALVQSNDLVVYEASNSDVERIPR